MKMKVFTAVLLLGSSSYALAADPALPVEEIPTGFNWTGGYVGGQVGYAWGTSRLENVGGGNYAEPDPDGFFGGVYTGYNHDFGGIIIGIDADLNFSDVNGSGEGLRPDGTPFGGVTVTGNQKWNGAVRARLGYAIDRFLPYIAGGVSFAEYEMTVDDNGTVGEFKDTYTGWNIGGGLDYAFTDNLIFRTEYRYSDFGSEVDSANIYDTDLSAHDIRLGVAYKF